MLSWESSHALALALINAHPDAELDTLGLEQLNAWILELPGFMDEPALVNDGILTDVLRDWYEEVTLDGAN
jgi:FeS assembly protein IscX